MKKYSFSIVVLGSSGSGKTSLIKRFISNEIVENYDPTIHEVYEKKTFFNETNIKLTIKDTAGEEQIAGMFSSLVRTTDSFIVVYSVRKKESFERAKQLLNLIQSIKGNNVGRILVSTCCDSEYREVSPSEGYCISEHYNCSFAEVSSLLNMNCVQVFQELCSQMMFLEEEKRLQKPKERGISCCLL